MAALSLATIRLVGLTQQADYEDTRSVATATTQRNARGGGEPTTPMDSHYTLAQGLGAT